MPSFCSVQNCTDKYGREGNISFHKFPLKRKDILRKWCEFTLRGAHWIPNAWSSICSRHFREEDFRHVNERKHLEKSAVPSVSSAMACPKKPPIMQPPPPPLLPPLQPLLPPLPPVAEQGNKPQPSEEPQLKEKEKEEVSRLLPELTANCRLCGVAAAAAATFATNFEIYGIIQKCFPTLNIRQDDALPKDLCRQCLKRLESFGRFIDTVLKTQGELETEYRSEKPNNSKNPVERTLKIKQEPVVVPVKQELGENADTLLAMDLDETDLKDNEDDFEQKYSFCDYPLPLLNTQDIINDCDIMEIINLEDPFINIPDDDCNTIYDKSVVNPETLKQDYSSESCSVYESLQSQLILDEHSYAYVTDDFKVGWTPLKDFCKTEKIEEFDEAPQTPVDHDAMFPAFTPESAAIPPRYSHDPEVGPMCGSIGELSERPPHQKPQKPNIIVLNESIVEASSSAFKLHECFACHLRFFSVESLQQHIVQAHHHCPSPMVSVPTANLLHEDPENPDDKRKVFDGAQLPPLPPEVRLPTESAKPKELLELAKLKKKPARAKVKPPPRETVSRPQDLANPRIMYAHYMQLHRRYRRLQLKCKSLEAASDSQPGRPFDVRRRRFGCGHCHLRFSSILRLLRHKQEASHCVRKPKQFGVHCIGCEKFFRSRKALRNHMQYICQMLSLRWCSMRMKTFKCRYCRSISFTHWRLYRKHELQCRVKIAQRKNRLRRVHRHASSHPTKFSTPALPPPSAVVAMGGAAKHQCPICAKQFKNSNGLNQHRITHSDKRSYECRLCGRNFKRRHGLLQHMRSLHMQLKPYLCHVCQRTYALKCDMLRCRHSLRFRGASAARVALTTILDKL